MVSIYLCVSELRYADSHMLNSHCVVGICKHPDLWNDSNKKQLMSRLQLTLLNEN